MAKSISWSQANSSQINSDILELMKKRDLALKTANRSKFSHDRQHFAMLWNKVVKTLRKAKADFFPENN